MAGDSRVIAEGVARRGVYTYWRPVRGDTPRLPPPPLCSVTRARTQETLNHSGKSHTFRFL